MMQIDSGDPSHLVARIPYAAFLGLRADHDAEGLHFCLPYSARLVGNTSLPAVHGGVVAGFMETAAQLHVLLVEPAQPRIPKTIDFSIDYLRSVGPRDSYARCSITRLGWRVAQVQIHCWQESATLPVALARVHFLLGSTGAAEPVT